jgi:hypothetical protein
VLWVVLRAVQVQRWNTNAVIGVADEVTAGKTWPHVAARRLGRVANLAHRAAIERAELGSSFPEGTRWLGTECDLGDRLDKRCLGGKRDR